ncbi:MAG: hypothetical protein WD156_08875 [Acidimicrobiia bacterium]
MTEPDPFFLYLETIAIAARLRRFGQHDAGDLVETMGRAAQPGKRRLD